jgi:hypothetical protein
MLSEPSVPGQVGAMSQLQAGKDVSMEEEETPSVGSVTRQRLVETVTD